MGAGIDRAKTSKILTDSKDMKMKYLNLQTDSRWNVNPVNELRHSMRKWFSLQWLALPVLMLATPVFVYAQSASLASDGTLQISGSGKNEWITIEGSGEGVLSVKTGKKANVVIGTFTDVVSLSVEAKGGRNQIRLMEVSMPGSIGVTAKGGNDVLTLTGQISAGGDFDIDLNGGNNTIDAKKASISVQGSAAFDGNGGKDKLTLPSIVTGRHLMIDTAGGVDKIVLGKKNDYLVSVGQRLTLNGGRGSNTINVYGAEVASAIRLMSGSDVDKYTIENTKTESFFDIKSGGGNDHIISRNNIVMDDYRIHCGGGVDRVTLKSDAVSSMLQQRCDE